jgi:hypothetical protein
LFISNFLFLFYENSAKPFQKICGIRIETSVGDVDIGIVAVVGKVNPTEVCHWFKWKTRKDVKIVCPDPLVENARQVRLV